MRIWVYCICRNEERMLPYFIRHYETFAERLTFFDGKSNDATRTVIASCPKAICLDWPGTDAICDDEFTAFANERWKEAIGKADWIMWMDADEFIYHPFLVKKLEQYLAEGVEVPLIDGFTMLSDSFPTTIGQIYDEIKTGIPDGCWSKRVVFRGTMFWGIGRHSIHITERPFKPSVLPEIKLLHYRGLGMDYIRERHARNWARVPQRCRDKLYGINCDPNYKEHHGLAWFEQRLSEPRVNVI